MNLRLPPARFLTLLGCLVAATLSLPAAAAGAELPHLAMRDGRHALIVDGAPFLILGAQCHNSSAWPATLPDVWAAIDDLHANTLEVPVYWEQFEPERGKYDPAMVDTLIAGARAHGVRLVLLWFATWKNGSSHYAPLWIKGDPEHFPRAVGVDGRRIDSPSPHAPDCLAADTTAFRALMRHLKTVDAARTVIMVQVENEPGMWNGIRDHSAAAQALFEAPVPVEALRAQGKADHAGEAWAAAFGPDADEFFHAWSVARFIGQVAAAGKAEYPLPLYVNAALRDPLTPGPAGTYESGGPTDNVLALWKAAAPAVDILAPDIYVGDGARYRKVLGYYARPDNPLFVPETGGRPGTERYCYETLGRQAIGWSPFGLDYTVRAVAPGSNRPTGAAATEPFAMNYRVLGPMMRELAQLSFEGRLHGAAEEADAPVQTIALGKWTAVISYGVPAFGFGRDPKGNPEPVGRALIAQLGQDEFLVTGYHCRIDFKPADPASTAQREFVRVEEGGYANGVFHVARIWNGDETDWGLNFGAAAQVVRVRLGTF